MPRDKWFTKKQIARIESIELKRLAKAAIHLTNEIQESMTVLKVADRGGRDVVKVRKGKSGRRLKHERLHVVSRPDEPPAVDTGIYMGSFAWQIFRKGKDIIARVGTNQKRARRLEYGFTGRDKLGRTIDQKPRPHVAPAFRKNRKKIQSILAGG